MLTFYGGGLPHFVDHLVPIYKELPDEIRGPFHARAGGAARALALGIEPIRVPPRRAELVVVASFEDCRQVAPSPVVLVNHGVGQRYDGDPRSAAHSSYSGGRGRDRVALFLCPSERDAEVCRQTAPAVAVGVPYLDPYHRPVTRVTGLPPKVVISFHADIHVCPETRWAFPYYQEGIREMVEEGYLDILGHAHPRVRAVLERYWSRLKVPFLATFAEVLAHGDVFVCDNSSTLYEFASTGRPVVVMNAPWYRRDVYHGLRFWDHIPGIEVDNPELLGAAIEMALEDPPNLQQKREDAVAYAYNGVALDGRATQRAVNALMELVDGRQPAGNRRE